MVKELQIQSLIRDVPNFPKQGIVFKDITPLLAHPEARKSVVEEIANNYQDQKIDAIAAVEARGFIFGSLLAEALSVPFIPIRKSGKLPFKKIHEEYALEYGTASIEMHEDAIQMGSRVLIHDDLLATGGTSTAAANMIKKLGGEVVGFSFVINLTFLDGERLLTERFGVKPHYLVSY
ncbi:MAG: adenine phosphoribosyltransferase [Cyclobacteriaceae bacterium]|jgi:adenine phosphoribosyltransferase|nr:adenine phosphoribosyltransferase [Cyclobacteriaceae bacterium]